MRKILAQLNFIKSEIGVTKAKQAQKEKHRALDLWFDRTEKLHIYVVYHGPQRALTSQLNPVVVAMFAKWKQRPGAKVTCPGSQ